MGKGARQCSHIRALDALAPYQVAGGRHVGRTRAATSTQEASEMPPSIGLGRKQPCTDSRKQKPLSEKPRGSPDLGMSLPKALSLCEVRECPLENQNCQDTSQARWGRRLPGLAGWAGQGERGPIRWQL